MTNGLLGKKLGMTQIFDENRLTPVTVIEAGPCRVVTIKTKARDGYEAVQLSYGEVKERKLSRAELGHLKRHGAPASRVLREFEKDGDAVVIFNFRGDRAIEISRAFDDVRFDKFDRVRHPDVLYTVIVTGAALAIAALLKKRA